MLQNFLIIFIGLILGVTLPFGCAEKRRPPKTAVNIDVARYMGTWHEIARLPFPFEIDCFGSSAKYEPINEEEFLITNYCWKKSFFGPVQRAQAQAWIEDPAENAKFKVSFFWPFAIDYWVLYVDADYRTALVGTPDRKYLWIMSRDFQIDEATYRAMLERAKAAGFDVTDIIRTPQRSDKALSEKALDAPPDSEGMTDGGVPDTRTDTAEPQKEPQDV